MALFCQKKNGFVKNRISEILRKTTAMVCEREKDWFSGCFI